MIFDEIGNWSEIKLDIIRKYAAAYSAIMAAQARPALHHVYIDAFAGSGMHLARSTGDYVPGSPLNALLTKPPFKEYFLIDIAEDKLGSLRGLVGDRPDVQVLAGDCNDLLMDRVFPQVKFEHYRRGLCLLDPYGLDLDWRVIATAGSMRSMELFVNFPVMDINRNVLWRDSTRVDPADVERMTRFWGDASWREVAYYIEATLFGDDVTVKAIGNRKIVDAFRDRLKTEAGLAHVATPLAMRNAKGSTVYYLFFASQNSTGLRIVGDIFKKYR